MTHCSPAREIVGTAKAAESWLKCDCVTQRGIFEILSSTALAFAA